MNRQTRRALTSELRELGYKRIVTCDTEYNFGIDVEGNPLDGNPLRPVCICARDLLSNESWELWLGEFPAQPPFPLDETTLLSPSTPALKSAPSWRWGGRLRFVS